MCQQTFALTYSIFSDILVGWLQLADVSRLDLACNNTAVRTQFLHAVASSSLIIQDPRVHQAAGYANFLQWVGKRRIHLNNIHIPARVFDHMECHSPGPIAANTTKRLKTLHLEQCIDICDQKFISIIKNCPYLRTLIVGSSGYKSWITDKSLEALARYCPKIQHIKIENNMFITDHGIQKVVTACHDLRKVCLLKCVKIGRSAVKSIAENCAKLEKFSISDNLHITTSCLATLLEKCKELKSLRVVRCKAALPVDANKSSMLGLDELHYVGSPICTKHNLAAFVNRCAHLTVLYVSGVASLSAEEIALMSHSNLQKLRSLRFDSCHHLSVTALNALLKQCPYLEEVAMHSSAVTDEIVHCIVDSCRAKLLRLDLSWCDRLSDTTITALSTHCRELHSVSLKGARHITANGVHTLLNSCTKLESLNIQFCTAVIAEKLQLNTERSSVALVM